MLLANIASGSQQWCASDVHLGSFLSAMTIRVDTRGVEAEFRAKRIAEAKAVKSVVEKFREKYGAKDVKKYYSKFDVAVLVEVG
jgi:23S rRNA G2445 N2-methylase RlmL